MSKIIGTMLVKNEADKMLSTVIQQLTSICDIVIVADDGSDDNSAQVCADHGAIVYTFNTSMWGVDESIRRKFLWEKAIEHGNDGDWIMYLDADETIENITQILYFIEPIEEAGLDAIAFRKYDMWDKDHYRDDKLWNVHDRAWLSIVKYDKKKDYIWNNKVLHGGSFPINAATKIALIEGINIQHWGWATPEERLRKYTRYMEIDPLGVSGSLEQYKSIMEENPNLVSYSEVIEDDK